MSGCETADLLIVNAYVLTLDPWHPTAESVLIREGRIRAVGCSEDIRFLAGSEPTILDADGGLAIPAFHDAHLHLLAWARSSAALECRNIATMPELQNALIDLAKTTPDSDWVRGNGYDEFLLGRHPDRHDLDAAIADRPVRLQHRSLHLDVLNSRALHVTGLIDVRDRRIEREPDTDEPTGRLFNAGDLLRGRVRRPSYEALARDVRRAGGRLLSWGVTTVQDATFTNAAKEWALFHRLAADKHLRIRTFMHLGAPHWRDAHAWQPESRVVRLGPVKLMLDASTSVDDFRAELHAARAAGHSVAVHATGEDELAVALDAFRSAPPRTLRTPNRIEHGSVVPPSMIRDIRDLDLTVVGQPGLVFDRGDVFRSESPAEQHGWLHRGRSWLAHGVPYAAGSDAPVTEPNPLVTLAAARRRATKRGQALEPPEALAKTEALQACTLGPAESVGVDHEIGRLRPGMVADIAILDPDALELEPAAAADRSARMTIMQGRIVWHRGE